MMMTELVVAVEAELAGEAAEVLGVAVAREVVSREAELEVAAGGGVLEAAVAVVVLVATVGPEVGSRVDVVGLDVPVELLLLVRRTRYPLCFCS